MSQNRSEPEELRLTLKPIKIGSSLGFIVYKRIMELQLEGRYEVIIRRVR